MLSSVHSVRIAGLDKFYTRPDIAEMCVKSVLSRYPPDTWKLIVEPSAGNGSFLTHLPNDKTIGLDIAPDHDAIHRQDFFTYTPPDTNGPILVIGNPPFGKVSSLAVKFFNHAAEWASVIAFIVPRTFRRTSLHNRLNPNFHLVSDTDIPVSPCAFHPVMTVKCCFQIWEKSTTPRPPIVLSTTHPDWDFLPFGPLDATGQPTPPIGADFAIRAYGGACGEIVTTDLHLLRPKSWHWIRSNIDSVILQSRFASLDYTVSTNTARQNSIGKGELVSLYREVYT